VLDLSMALAGRLSFVDLLRVTVWVVLIASYWVGKQW